VCGQRENSEGQRVGHPPYDGNGMRVQKAVGSASTVFVWSGSRDVAEYDNGAAPGSPSREFIWADALPGSGLVASITAGAPPTTNYFHSDHLSTRVITNSSGTDIGEQGHFPFGESWYTQNSANGEWVFTSYQRDAESGLDYALARYYDSTAARFCSADPVGGQPGDPQSWNRYSYVRNDPANLTDPSGQSFFGFLGQIFKFLFNFFTGGAFWTPPMLGTPPIIEDDPTSDTSALLGSINHPVDPSQFVINDFTLASDPGADSFDWAPFVGPCSKALFGVDLLSFTPASGSTYVNYPSTARNGTFTGAMAGTYQGFYMPLGPDPSVFTVTDDVSMTTQTLTRNYIAAGHDVLPGFKISGYTNALDPLTTYTGWNQSQAAVVGSQLWELGNSLADMTRRQIPNSWNTAYGSKNTEPGHVFTDCIYSSILSSLHF